MKNTMLPIFLLVLMFHLGYKLGSWPITVKLSNTEFHHVTFPAKTARFSFEVFTI